MHRALTLSIAFILLITATSCGGSSGATSTPQPTSAPTQPALPTLSQSVTSKNGVTVRYPDGWQPPIAQIGVFLYNSKDAESAVTLQRMSAGSIYFQINTQPQNGKTPGESFDFSFSGLAQGLKITLGAKQTIKLNNAEVVKATGASQTMGLYVALLPGDAENYITAAIYTQPQELESQTPLIEAILATVSYKKP